MNLIVFGTTTLLRQRLTVFNIKNQSLNIPATSFLREDLLHRNNNES